MTPLIPRSVLFADPRYTRRGSPRMPPGWVTSPRWAPTPAGWSRSTSPDPAVLDADGPAPAHRITVPILVAQGANDPRIKQAEAEQIVAALRSNGVPHEYLLFHDEGHGLAKPENRERYYAAAERFLAGQLGGRMQP